MCRKLIENNESKLEKRCEKEKRKRRERDEWILQHLTKWIKKLPWDGRMGQRKSSESKRPTFTLIK